MKGWKIRVWIGLFIASYACWRGVVGMCLGQSEDVIWSRSFNLSDTPQLSTHPAIVTDGYGYVHVFWSEEVGGEARVLGDLGGSGNSIMYTRWDGASWSSPVDVLFVPGEGIAEFVSVSVDSENRLHAVWTGQDSIYYSSAPSLDARSAHAWSMPVAVATGTARTQWETDVVVDTAGAIHIAYATQGSAAGVYYVVSRDGAATWEMAGRLSDPLDPAEESFMNVRLELDGNDRLHAIWATTEHEGYGQGIYYARSTDAGQSWSTPARLGYRDAGDEWVGWPYLMIDGESVLHLIYIDGSNKGRLHRISVDGGATWNAPVEIIPEMEGINGYVIPVSDRLGQLHLIINMRPTTNQVVGIYYARELGERWSTVSPLDDSSPAAPSAHYAAATVRLGNEIYVVYNQISPGEIWLLHGVLPGVEPLEAPVVPEDRPPVGQESAPIAITATPVSAVTDTPMVGVAATLAPWAVAPPPRSSSSMIDIGLPSVGAVLVLVVGVAVWTRARSRRVQH